MFQTLRKAALALLANFICRTLRLMNDPWAQSHPYRAHCGKYLICLWHEVHLYGLHFYRDNGFSILVEASAKGDILAAVAHSFGVKTFRITDHLNDPQNIRGTLGFIKYVKQGNVGGIALDGPNGPYHVPKKGIFMAARRSGSEIIPVGIWYERKITLKSRWDQYQLPLPFSKVVLLFDEPFPTAGVNKKDADLYAQKLARRVDLIMQKAAELGKNLLAK
jgi:lysophospholipid acyltransferase (LPLAT)-like uncharacterized protein